MAKLTLEARWAIQRQLEHHRQQKVIDRVTSGVADPIETLYPNVEKLLCFGTEEQQHASLDAVGIPRDVTISHRLTLQERVEWLDRGNAKRDEPTRGKPPYGTVESFKRYMAVWLPAVEMTDEWLHNRLDQCEVPREIEEHGTTTLGVVTVESTAGRYTYFR